MKCGIVILNYNDFQTTISLLNRIADYEAIEHIVVVDNCSSDGSYDQLVGYASERIVVLQALGNNGYSAGNNVGVRYLVDNTDVELIGIANPDVAFDNSFVVKIKEQFARHNDYAIITGLQMNGQGEIGMHPFWPEYSTWQYFKEKLAYFPVIWRLLHGYESEKYMRKKLDIHEDFFEVGVVGGSLFFVKAEDFIKVNLFDENVFLYCEEDILAKKLKGIGKKTGIDSTIKFVHYGSRTINKVLVEKTRNQYFCDSLIYFFNQYQSNNKLLQLVNEWLCSIIFGVGKR